MSGHHFDIVTPISDESEIRFYGEYDPNSCRFFDDIIFNGSAPCASMAFKFTGPYSTSIENISEKYYSRGGKIPHDKYSRI